ncbi:hypothetical protein BY458DRAFT_506822 [Sporodiniella umbellata]|nr:hypothetical protein BY458DRAFT_506822 [Sporodiniella umbellata]
MPGLTLNINKIRKMFTNSMTKEDSDSSSPTIKMSTVNDYGVYIPPSPNYYNDDMDWISCQPKQNDYFQIKP